MVAPTSSTVFILGETGTGKELIARAIHQASPRAAKTMVKLNCAAISAGLVESELFGHLKGAFTGASDKRIGRFELADGGTLFLDEVSELPLDTQVKLLRVLQEQEFEPVGSSKTVKVDVRVIAASNRDLPTEVAAGRFRADLYHRLNVFPLHVPPLRERREDIPQLANHFMALNARKLNRSLRAIDESSMMALLQYPWPGNIRELQNVIERSVILSTGPLLMIDSAQFKAISAAPSTNLDISPPPSPPQSKIDADLATFADVQRSHLLTVLQKTRGVIEGAHGAAKILNMKPSTVRYRIRKLGITRNEY
jgi:formate hydrogenlyase transcriptional activator